MSCHDMTLPSSTCLVCLLSDLWRLLELQEVSDAGRRRGGRSRGERNRCGQCTHHSQSCCSPSHVTPRNGCVSQCFSCALSSTSLNCGWCAKTGVCTAGTAAGPANNATCGVNGWGFQGAACTQQAQCNTLNNNGCMSCVQGGSGVCGYCGSTGRCETGNSTAAVDGDCSSQWSFSTATCPAVYDPCNAYNGKCGKCESAPANLKCGYCTQTDKCISGNVNGPTTAGATCSSLYWNFQSCPTDYMCARQTECGSCQVQTAWSDHTNNNRTEKRSRSTLVRVGRLIARC